MNLVLITVYLEHMVEHQEERKYMEILMVPVQTYHIIKIKLISAMQLEYIVLLKADKFTPPRYT